MNNATTRNTVIRGSVIRALTSLIEKAGTMDHRGIVVTEKDDGILDFTGLVQGDIQQLRCTPFGEDYRVTFSGTPLFMEFVEAEGFSPALDKLRLYFGFFTNGELVEQYLADLANDEIIIMDGPAVAEDEVLIADPQPQVVESEPDPVVEPAPEPREAAEDTKAPDPEPAASTVEDELAQARLKASKTAFAKRFTKGLGLTLGALAVSAGIYAGYKYFGGSSES